MDNDRKTAGKNGAKGASVTVLAAVVGGNRDTEPVYHMYQASDISEEGVFLRGPMLLELGERLTIELAFADGTKIRGVVCVDRVDREPEPGLDVRFVELSNPARALLRAQVTEGI